MKGATEPCGPVWSHVRGLDELIAPYVLDRAPALQALADQVPACPHCHPANLLGYLAWAGLEPRS